MSKLKKQLPESKDGDEDGSEEEDFMSDKFIIQAEQTKFDLTNNSNKSYSEQRRKRLNEGFEKGKIRSMIEREKEARKKGLSKSLFGEMDDDEIDSNSDIKGKRKERFDADDEDDRKGGNKALRMMLSMGFKPGQGLGKHLAEVGDEDSESDEDLQNKPNINPLDIDERWMNPRVRSGIGITPRISLTNKPISKDIDSATKINSNENNAEEDFRLRTKQAHEQRHMETLLVDARKTCYRLDLLPPFNMTYSPLWINPESLSKQKDDLPPHIVELIDFAFIGLDYINEKSEQKEKDMQNNQESQDSSNADDEGDKNEQSTVEQISHDDNVRNKEDIKEIAIQRALEAKRFCLLPSKARLQITLSHLRRAHNYCLFCGHQYVDQQELEKECPGEEEEDH